MKSVIKKTVVISTDDNENYISYLPYIQQAWNLLGWDTLTFYLGNKRIQSTNNNNIIYINPITGYRDCTVVQTYRLFGYQYIEDGIIMTSDVDMMPLSDYWKPDINNVTCYGYDLTYYKQIPICYIAANKKNWKDIIQENSVEQLLEKSHFAKSNNFDEWWFTDQLIITKKILEYKLKPYLINRGFSRYNLAIGRIDRVAWDLTRNNDDYKIDAHMPRPFDPNACADLINNILIPNVRL